MLNTTCIARCHLQTGSDIGVLRGCRCFVLCRKAPLLERFTRYFYATALGSVFAYAAECTVAIGENKVSGCWGVELPCEIKAAGEIL